MRNIERKQAFSLVELMISLITISIISAAFAPIITKKLSANTISVGGNNSNGDGDAGKADICGGKTCDDGYYIDEESCQCKRCSQGCKKCTKATNCLACDQKADGYEYVWSDKLSRCVTNVCYNEGGKPSEACCHSLNAKFISKEQSGTVDLCMMEYNVGDEEYTGASNFPFAKYGIALNTAGGTCLTPIKNDLKCCWNGNTSSGDSAYSANYNGKSRTVCMFNAAQKICDNIVPGDSAQGAWRTPTTTELSNIATVINAEKEGAGVLSRYLANIDDNEEQDYSKFGLQLCDASASNKGSNKCPDSNSCSGAYKCSPNMVWGEVNRKPYILTGGVYKATTTQHQNCNNDGNCWYSQEDRAASVRCVSRNIYTRTQDISSEIITYTAYEPRNQEDCNKYNSIFINKKYTGTEKNLCVLARNFGDTDNTSNESNFNIENDNSDKVTLVESGTKCSGGYCCWKGTTSTGSGDYPYTPSKRTLCRFQAAQLLCKKFAPDAVSANHWKVPSNEILANLALYINAETKNSYFLNKYLEQENIGLQFCDANSTSYGTNKCPHGTTCSGAYKCGASMIWGTTDRNPYILTNGIYKSTTTKHQNCNNDGNCWDSQEDWAASVRCVTDTVDWNKE